MENTLKRVLFVLDVVVLLVLTLVQLRGLPNLTTKLTVLGITFLLIVGVMIQMREQISISETTVMI